MLADGLRELGPFRPNVPQTNIVVADIVEGDLADWLAAFEREGLLAVAFGHQRMRMVTHINISRADIESALARVQRVVGAVPV
jgi:threonine aldolase